MHHKAVTEAHTGSLVGLHVKNLDSSNMPRVGSILAYKDDPPPSCFRSFIARLTFVGCGEIRTPFTGALFMHCLCTTGTVQEIVSGRIPLLPGDEADFVFVAHQMMAGEEFLVCPALGTVAITADDDACLIGRIVKILEWS